MQYHPEFDKVWMSGLMKQRQKILLNEGIFKNFEKYIDYKNFFSNSEKYKDKKDILNISDNLINEKNHSLELLNWLRSLQSSD